MTSGPELGNVIALGDFNEGPFADLMEAEFLVHNLSTSWLARSWCRTPT